MHLLVWARMASQGKPEGVSHPLLLQLHIAKLVGIFVTIRAHSEEAPSLVDTNELTQLQLYISPIVDVIILHC